VVVIEHLEQLFHSCGTGFVSGTLHEVTRERLSLIVGNQLLPRRNPQRRASATTGRVYLAVRPACINEARVEDGCAAAALRIVGNGPTVNPVIEEGAAQGSDNLGPLVSGCTVSFHRTCCCHPAHHLSNPLLTVCSVNHRANTTICDTNRCDGPVINSG